MNINNPDHPHHAVWREHVESVLDDPKNPKVVQWKSASTPSRWNDSGFSNQGLAELPWHQAVQYRIKPATVTRTLTYPAPLREAPAEGTEYWTLLTGRVTCVELFYWNNSHYDRRFLSRGMCFATEEDALAAAQAIFGGEV